MTKTAINLYGLWDWFKGDLVPVVDLVRIADEAGVGTVELSEHLTMGEHTEKYPYGSYPVGMDIHWHEPITLLSAIAATTKRIKLSTGVLIAPLRPVVLLAKQLVTLHFLSRGRVEIGLGVGWQEEEYIGCGIPFEGRFNRLDEQVAACKLLWSTAPASFKGEHVNFDRLHTYPQIDPASIKILLGLTEKPKNLERLASYGDGWIPMTNDAAKLGQWIDTIKEKMMQKGRDPSKFDVRSSPTPAFNASGKADFDETAKQIPALLKAGVTTLSFSPFWFCKGPEDFPAFVKKIAQL